MYKVELVSSGLVHGWDDIDDKAFHCLPNSAWADGNRAELAG